MDVWLMTDPMFWIMLGAWPGFFIGFCRTLRRCVSAYPGQEPAQ